MDPVFLIAVGFVVLVVLGTVGAIVAYLVWLVSWIIGHMI